MVNIDFAFSFYWITILQIAIQIFVSLSHCVEMYMIKCHFGWFSDNFCGAQFFLFEEHNSVIFHVDSIQHRKDKWKDVLRVIINISIRTHNDGDIHAYAISSLKMLALEQQQSLSYTDLWNNCTTCYPKKYFESSHMYKYYNIRERLHGAK